MIRMKGKVKWPLFLAALMVLLVALAGAALAADWPQFQKDELNSGKTGDPLPNSSGILTKNVFTLSGDYYGIDTTPIVKGDHVYVLAGGSNATKLFKYQKNGTNFTGAKVWESSQLTNTNGFQLAAPAYGEAVSGGTTYNVIFTALIDPGSNNSSYSKVRAVKDSDGSFLWTKELTSTHQINTPVTYFKYTEDGTEKRRVVVGSWRGTATTTEGRGVTYCLNADNGNIEWQYQVPDNDSGYYWSGAVVVGDYVIFGDDKGKLTSVNYKTGVKSDQKAVGACIRSSLTVDDPSASNPNVFFADKNNKKVYKVSFVKSTGEFGTVTGSAVLDEALTSSPVYYSGRIYVGSGGFSADEAKESKLYCLNASDLSQKWAYIARSGGIQSSPVITTKYTGTGSSFPIYIYFTTNNKYGKCYCIKDDGNITGNKNWDDTNVRMWYYQTSQAGTSGGYILQGVAATERNVADKGWVFFGNDGGYLYGISQN
jgi:outer membrane protein assembly factor BamB